jgi:hypothetical protein
MSNSRRGFGSEIGFIDHLYKQPVTTKNYSAIANLHTLQFTVTYTLMFSVCYTLQFSFPGNGF